MRQRQRGGRRGGRVRGGGRGEEAEGWAERVDERGGRKKCCGGGMYNKG
jgi:hypothetical protein